MIYSTILDKNGYEDSKVLKTTVKGFGNRLSWTRILMALSGYVTLPNHLFSLSTFILFSNVDDIELMGLVGLFTEIIQVWYSFYIKQMINKY